MLTDLTASDAKRYTVAYGTVVTRGAHVYLALGSLPPLPRGQGLPSLDAGPGREGDGARA